VTKWDRIEIEEEIGAMMDSIQAPGRNDRGFSISIHAPCSIQVHHGDCTGDHVDVHIHAGGPESLELSAASIAELVEGAIAGTRHGTSDPEGK
jgi:hypothetical protein